MSDTSQTRSASRRLLQRGLKSLGRFLFLDLALDRETRGVLIYAGVIVLFGTMIYHWLEGWSLLDSAYFVVITLTTIGFGDLTPTKPITKLVTIFYGINGVAILLMLLDQIRRLRDRRFREDASKE